VQGIAPAILERFDCRGVFQHCVTDSREAVALVGLSEEFGFNPAKSGYSGLSEAVGRIIRIK